MQLAIQHTRVSAGERENPELYVITSLSRQSGEQLVITSPFSDRQHLSYDDCLEVRREIIGTVLCCIVY